MIGRGWSDFQIRLACAQYCKRGADDPDLAVLIQGGRKKWDKPDPEDHPQANAGPSGGTGQSPPSAASPIIATPYIWTEPEKIPKRDFLYGRRLLRKFLTATVAPGGVGKSTLEITEALAMVTGRPLLGVRVDAPLKVWFYNLEDPAEEIARRIQATAKQYFLGRDDIGDRLFVSCGREQPLVIAETPPRSSSVICRPIVDSLVAQLIEHRIDVLIVDPFVSCHKVEENDNNAIDMVAKEWGRVADLANCAIELVHHTRKGEQEVTTESARGAKPLTNAGRFVRVVTRMGRGNGRGAGGGGDSVGVVTTWEWPDPLVGVTGRDFDKVAAVIRAGKWRADVQAKLWVGHAVAQAMRLDLDKKADKTKVKGLIEIWVKSGALLIVEGQHDKRNPRSIVEVKPDDD